MDVEHLATAARTDPAAMNELVRRVLPQLRGFLGRWVTDADADDVIQNTMIAVSRRIDRFEPHGPGSFMAWARGVARVEASEQRRGERRQESLRQATAARMVPAPATTPSSRMNWQQRFEMIQQEAARLPPAQFRAIQATLEGRDARALGEREGISRVYARVLRARAWRSLHVRIERRMRLHCSLLIRNAPRLPDGG